MRELALQDPRAPFIRRWVAGTVDIVFVGAAILVVNRLVPEDAHTAHPLLGAVVAVAVGVAYYWLPEAMWGRTLGKLMAGLRVVDENGHPPAAGKALVRTLLRVVEVNPLLLGGLPAAIVAYTSKTGQRMGDLLAHTYVVKATDLAAFTQRAAEAPRD